MTAGDVVLTPLSQANGQSKIRPAIALRQMLPFGDWLICGVSSQLQQQVAGFDEIIDAQAADFTSSGLKSTSLIRVGFLAVLPLGSFLGKIGSIAPERHRRLLDRLSDHLKT